MIHSLSQARGDYDHCRVPGARQLSPLEVGEDNSKLEPKKFKSIDMVKQKVVIGVFRHAESKSGLYFVLTLFLHRFLATFWSKHMTVLPVFRKTTTFWVKLGSQIFQNIRP